MANVRTLTSLSRTRLALALALPLVLIGWWLAPAQARAANAPFACDAFGYLFQTNGQSPVHSIIQIDLATGAFNPNYAFTPGYTNAVGYNVLDNYMYGMQLDQTTGDVTAMVRIHADGTVDNLGIPSGLMAAGSSIVTGDVDSSGHYWVLDQAANRDHWYEIDLAPGSPTYGQIIDQGSITPLAGVLPPSDWVFINGKLYGLPDANPGGTGNAHIVAWTPGATTFTDLGATSIADGSGAVYADAAGYMYASINATGDIYRINPITKQTILVSHATASTGNDGARCARAVIPTITVTKTVNGRSVPTDQFIVGLKDSAGTSLTSATTSGKQTAVSTTNWPVSQGRTYTITDAMAPGSPSPIGDYDQSIVCKDATGATVPTGGSAGAWTLTVAQATYYTCDVTNSAQADVQIVKSASPNPAVPGTDETYKLAVTNNGPNTAKNVLVTDPLPEGETFVSASAGCSEMGGTVTCALAALGSGAMQTFTITADVASSLSSCPKNAASVVTDTPDPDPANNISTVCVPPAPKANLVVRKVASDIAPRPGGEVMYTLVVSNDGPSDATGVTVSDAIPSALKVTSAQPSQGSCNIAQSVCELGAIASHGSAQVLVTATVAASASGAETNCVEVIGQESDPDKANNQACATINISTPPAPSPPRAEIGVTKTVNHAAARLGQKLSYTLTVVNHGPGAATEVNVTDTSSVPLKVLSAHASQGACKLGRPLTCALGPLPSGARVAIKVVARTTTLGRENNTATVACSCLDPNPHNNIHHAKTWVRGGLRLQKTVHPATLTVGKVAIFRLKVTNPNRVALKHVRVCDSLPSGLLYLASSPLALRHHGRYCWTLATIQAHRSIGVEIRAEAKLHARGRLVNHATATAPDAEPAHAHATLRVVSGPRVCGSASAAVTARAPRPRAVAAC